MECLMIYRFQIYEYSQQMDDNVEKEISCDVTLKIIDIILLNETSLNKPTVRRKMPLIMLTDWQIDDVSFHIFLPSSISKSRLRHAL